jgi:protocatechuate 3,4-dioxygenase beta subunit
MPDRRTFLRSGLWGLAAAGTGSLTLRAGAQATPASGDLGAYGDYLAGIGESPEDSPPVPVPNADPPNAWRATEDNILGPFYRPHAPFRGKLTPPLEPGDVLLITGRVWSLATRQPLASAVLDLWQANAEGRYDNDDPQRPPALGVFLNRCRLLTDDTGYYEVETIHPGAYRLAPSVWRPPHVHYLVRAAGHARLITQLYFAGDPHQQADRFIKPSLVVPLQEHRRNGQTWRHAHFDIVLPAV